MDTDTIPDIPNDNPETYCRLCFSGFYVEPLFPPDGHPKQAVIDLIARLVDIHVTMEMDYRCAVCRMCQMTLEGFHKYRERCRTLDDVLQRKRMELMHFQVKVEQQEELAQNAVGFEEDMVYCLSDTDDEDQGTGGGVLGEGLEHELEVGLVEDDGEEIDEEVEEELIRGDMLIKPEPYGMDDHAGKTVEEEEYDDDDDDDDQEHHSSPPKNFDTEQVVDLLEDSEGEDEKSMEASTRASSEAKGEDREKEEPLKPLPFEVSSDGAYRCTVCQETFRLMKEIKNHIRKQHPEQSMIYSCRFCAKKFSDTNSLRAHTRFHTMDFPFSCEECGAKFTMKARLDNHVSRYHDKNSPSYTDKRFKCTLCPRIFLQESGRNLHMLHFHNKKPAEFLPTEAIPVLQVLSCDGCNEHFDTREGIDAHFAEHHANDDEESRPKMSKRHKCPDCPKVFRHRTALRSHCVINHGTMPHKCDICGSSFERRTKLEKHKQNWHGEDSKNKVLERYKCDQCERFFVRNQDRFRHEQVVHNIESPAKLPTVWEGRKSNFPCSKCERKFPSMKTMRIHFALKHPDVPVRFKCTVCSKLFKHKTSLREHMMNHTGEHPFGCDQCEERFIRKKDVDRHMEEMHGSDDDDGEKKVRFPCPYCPRKLMTKTARAIHVTHNHADKEPIAKQVLSSLPKSMACQYCKKVFTNRNTLKLHILNHLGKLPHQCDQCDAGFYKPADLLRHKQRYHTGGSSLSLANRFKCAYCPRIFIRKSARRYHHTVFHGIERQAKLTGSGSSGHKRTKIKVEPDSTEYPCSLCSLVFVTGQMLQTHHQQHHPDQQFFYKCPHCPKRTVHRNAYVSHIRLHVGGYRYPCDQCNVKFDRQVLLIQHKKRYHSDDSKDVQRFHCLICNREFLRNQDRVRHQIVVHNYQVQSSGSQPAPSPGPSSAGGKNQLLLKIKQERVQLDVPSEPAEEDSQQPKKKVFAISSDVEEIDDDDDDEQEAPPEAEEDQEQHQEQEEHYHSEQESGQESLVPTISNVVSIKQEAMAARKEYNEY
ncbi:zinc finger protein 14 [Aedes aegypti]|uniref:Zinc finger protein n=1 Tax=Aedes aegypti TaxID=7159 RepID=A0A1S4FYB6_AEDAE|nr:zinc finger protein 14 [Aedes aegypti]